MELPNHPFYSGCNLTQHDADRFTLSRDGVDLHCDVHAGFVSPGSPHKLMANSARGAVDECVLLLNHKGDKLKAAGEQLEIASQAIPQTLEGMALAVGAQIDKLPPGILKTFKAALTNYNTRTGEWKV